LFESFKSTIPVAASVHVIDGSFGKGENVFGLHYQLLTTER
jgi:hypothetical protein